MHSLVLLRWTAAEQRKGIWIRGGKEGAGKTRKGGRKEEEEKEEQEEDEEAKKMQGKGNNISVLPFQRFVYHKYQTNMSVRKSNDTYEHVLASL